LQVNGPNVPMPGQTSYRELPLSSPRQSNKNHESWTIETDSEKTKHSEVICITRNVGQDGGHDKKLRNKMASDNARISIGI
jgi:hypothetical protein